MKKVLFIMLTICLFCIGLCFCVHAEDRTIIEAGNCGANGDNVTYVLYSDGELVISGEGDMKNDNSNSLLFTLFQSNDSIAKITIEGTVTHIGNYAFADCKNLLEVTLNENILSIGIGSFLNCLSLERINFPNNLSNIGEGAFSGCISLKDLVIPPHIKEIKSDTFNGCTSISTITFPPDLTHIFSNAFSFCSSLKNLILPTHLRYIDGWAFYGCSSLKNIKLNNKLEYIGAFAFDYTFDNLYIESLESYLNIETDPLYFNNLYLNEKPVTELIIPDTIKNIRGYSFYNCKTITSVVIPNKIFTIGPCAFSNCDKLKEVLIGNDVQLISSGAFQNCSSLETIKIGSNLTTIQSKAFNNDPKIKSIYYNGTEKSWNKILIYDENDSLLNATVHCICEHDYPDEWLLLLPATCTERGLSIKICSQCLKVESKVIPANHIDDNNDNICDECGFISETNTNEPTEPDTPEEPDVPEEKPCDCDCHEGGIKGFFFDLINFFEKLFGKNKVCQCGVKH